MLTRFFVLTYLLSWLWFGAAAYLLRSAGSNASGIGGLVFLPGVIMPALVAIAMTARWEGRVAVWQLLGGIFRWRVSIWWYGFAVGYMMAIKLAGAVVYRLAFSVWPVFTPVPWYFIAVALLVSTPIQAGEEIGWRAYALPRLTKRFGLSAASIILGVIWAAWHLPFFFIPGGDNTGQSFPVYVIAVIGISVAMAWLYWKTNQSLLLVMLMHASINNTAGIVKSPALATVNNPFGWPNEALSWILATLFSLSAVWFLFEMRNYRQVTPRLSLPIFI